MKVAIWTAGLLSTLLVGCATAPATFDVQNTRIIAAPKDEVWERVVEFFATNNLSIKTIEKDSGIIAADRLFNSGGGGLGTWASCGSGGLELPIAQIADLNVFVRPMPSGTAVTVNTHFSETRQFGNTPAHTVACNSTGELERTILTAASSPLQNSVEAQVENSSEIRDVPLPKQQPEPPKRSACGMVRQRDGSLKLVRC